MGKPGNQAAPSPDPKIAEAALKQAQLGEQWLGFAKDSFKVSQTRQAELDALTKTVQQRQLGVMDEQLANAREDRARYETTFRPIEDQFVKEAKNYATEGRQQAAAAEAGADVATAAASARETAAREAASVGINPNSGRFAAIAKAGETGTALATAGAKNNARRIVRDKGLALRADVVNLGRGLPAMSAQGTAAGLGAGGAAIGAGSNANSQYLATTGIMGQGYQGAMNGYGNQAGIMTNLYNTKMNAWSEDNRRRSEEAVGWGSAIGGAAGLIFSDEDAKEGKVPIPEGAALEALKTMPVEEWSYKEGMGDEQRHVGTYAQDFEAATGQGDGHSIPVQDAIGITMKAVQDLDAKVTQLAETVGIGVGGGSGKRPVSKKSAPAPANDDAPLPPAAAAMSGITGPRRVSGVR